jgi:hypothetical protein
MISCASNTKGRCTDDNGVCSCRQQGLTCIPARIAEMSYQIVVLTMVILPTVMLIYQFIIM